MNKIYLLGLLLLIAGCTSQKNKTAAIPRSDVVSAFSSISTDNVFVYVCEDSLRFTAYVKQDSTWLFLPDTSLKTTRVRSGSGAKYRGGRYLYWNKGEKALLQIPVGSLMNCSSVPREKSWAAAKLRGIDFRALGQEPGWYLEITDGKEITYIGNYGKDTLITPAPEPTTGAGRHTIYETDTLTVEISDEPCTDSMSGFKFPATVSLAIGGETYRGCGRRLSPE